VSVAAEILWGVIGVIAALGLVGAILAAVGLAKGGNY
jgi:hypothetical protein